MCLTPRLDEATSVDDVASVCEAVKQVLTEEVLGGRVRLPEEFVEPCEQDYARRLLHRAPGHRYTIVVMVWGAGQSTPIHDHAGKWCVECVYSGRIQVTSYRLIGERGDDVVRFQQESRVTAGVGAAGALIPPFEYHLIENADAAPAVTIHVYGGEMDGCNKFHPLGDGRYRREWCELCYSEDGGSQAETPEPS